MPLISFVDVKGVRSDVVIPVGHTLMEGAREHGVSGILADCGGACSCATCHVYVDPAWLDSLPAREQPESDMLEFAVDPAENSRLSCQIVVSDALDGLTVKLPRSQI